MADAQQQPPAADTTGAEAAKDATTPEQAAEQAAAAEAQAAADRDSAGDGGDAPVVDAEVVPEPDQPVPAPATGQQLAPSGQAAAEANMERASMAGAMSLISGARPDDVVERATEIADALTKVVKSRKLSTRIQQSDHLNISAWQTLGALIGAFSDQGGIYAVPLRADMVRGEDGQPVITEYTVRVKDWEWVAPEGGGKKQKRLKADREYEVRGHDFEAYAEARTATGLVVGAGHGACNRSEDTWAQRDDYALKSMAETRACSRALRQAAGWVVALAGYETTAEEEMKAQAEAPWWAQAAAEKDVANAKGAVTYLLTQGGLPDAKVAELAPEVLAAIAKWPSSNQDGAEPIGYVPFGAARAIRLVGRTLAETHKAANDAAAASASKEGGNDAS